jgi:hypothetical protein
MKYVIGEDEDELLYEVECALATIRHVERLSKHCLDHITDELDSIRSERLRELSALSEPEGSFTVVPFKDTDKVIRVKGPYGFDFKVDYDDCVNHAFVRALLSKVVGQLNTMSTLEIQRLFDEAKSG